MSLQIKNKCAVLKKNQAVQVEECLLPILAQDECTVQIIASGVCSSDVARGFDRGAYFYPLVMGHELAGVVTDVGASVSQFSVGDRVCVFPLLPCFECDSCKNKQYALCDKYDYYGSRRNGGFSERLNVKQWNLLKLPDVVGLEDGALIEPAAVVLHAIDKLLLKAEQSSRICVLGAGFLGLIAVQVLSRFYPKCEIHLVDRNQFKLNVGAQNGAITQAVCDSESWDAFLQDNEKRFDNVIEFIGTPDTFAAAIHIAASSARVVWAGNISGNLTIPKAQVSSILRKELTVLGTWNSIYKGVEGCDWSRAIDLFSKGLRPSELITLRIGLDELGGTLEKLYRHKSREMRFDTIKVLVKPNG